MKMYTCPMDPDVIQDAPGNCPKCGMKLMPMTSEHGSHEDHASVERDFKRRFFITLPFVILSILLSRMIQMWLGLDLVIPGQELLLFTIGTFIFFYGGLPFFIGARGEIIAKNFGMMTLVALAITAGYAFSVAATFLFPGESLYWEISTLISVFLLGHWLEMRAVRGATGALAELAKLIPPSAHRIVQNKDTSDGGRLSLRSHDSSEVKSSEQKIVDAKTEELVIGDLILVKPGEKIPIDGIVKDGESSINESMVTGESKPVGKKIGDKVIGGTINQDGALTIEVAKVGVQTAISQIMKLIREAQASKPNVQHLADRAASVLTFTAIIAGASAFVFWFFIEPRGAVFAATLAVSAIVVACPHALGLAIPTVTTITSTLGAKNGILIKDMKGLEIARKISYVVFDKTGTLTKGEFGVTDVILVSSALQNASRIRSWTSPSTASSGLSSCQDDIIRLAAAVEIQSQHSIGRGVVQEAKNKGLEIPGVKKFKSYPGRGAEGTVNNKRVLVGNLTLMKDLKISSFAEASAGKHDSKFMIHDSKFKANTPVYVAIDNKLAGIILLADIIREESKEAVKKLHNMGIKTAMLTGDTQDVADDVGKQLDMDTVFAQVLPEDKVNKIKELQNKGNVVAMVGDGVNDAPSLTQSHVGIAIGAGTDVAVESADIVLMKNDPMDVVKAISLSRKTNVKMIQNLVWATGYNVFAIPTAAGVFYSSLGILLRPEWAALLMSASSIIVVFNALLLRKVKLD